MSAPVVRVATRASALAMWQAERIAALLIADDPGLSVEFVPITTHADRHLDVPIAEIGGKGVFAKEVQHAVLDGRADVAVHSAKDLTSETVDGLILAAVPERGDARDALAGSALAELAPGSVVGTGSARRRVQLLAMRSDIEVVGIRGNIAKRLERLADLDAVVVAAVALERLGLSDRVAQTFGVDAFVPQVAQGALAVECRSDDRSTLARLARIEHAPSRLRVDAERAFLARLGGDCDLPAGAHATIVGDRVHLIGILAADADSPPIRRSITSAIDPMAACAAGHSLADELATAVRPAE